MKKIDIINSVNVLGRVRLHKIKDEKIKFILVDDYRKLRKASKEIEEDRQSIIDGFQRDFADELPEVRQLRVDGMPVIGHDAFLKAEADANKMLSDMMQEEVEVSGLLLVTFSDLLAAVSEEELTCEDIYALEGFIYK